MQRRTGKDEVRAAVGIKSDGCKVRDLKHNEQCASKVAGRPERSYRATVLGVIVGSASWNTAHALAAQTQLTYPQVVFALHALHNSGQIARAGRKFTARWGALSLAREPNHNFELLERLFHGIVNNI